MLYKKGPIPLYFQIYLRIKQEITTGDRPPGSPIPTLKELVEQTGISQGMIRKAFELLEMEGLIFKKPRTGTFVRESTKQVLWVPASSLMEIRERLLFDKVIHLSDGWEDAPNRVIDIFKTQDNVLKDGCIFKSHFLLISKEDDRRRNLSNLFVPLWRYNEVSLEGLRESPLKTVVNDRKIIKIRQIIRPWFCDSIASEHLKLPEGTPIFHRTLISFLADGRLLGVLEQLPTVYALERDIDIM
jgi:GntR family transcriptional regulator